MDKMMIELEILRRKLRFRAWHRGTREADLMLGPFADLALAGYGAVELQAFSEILEENDPDLYDWMTAQKSVPATIDGPVFQALMRHIAERGR